MKVNPHTLLHWLPPAAALFLAAPASAALPDARATVAALDTAYQAAVKANDEVAMAAILADDFVLVSGAGQVVTRGQLLAGARDKEVSYEQQDEIRGTQTVRQWGDTAIVTALLWVKGVDAGQPIDRKLWFSDTYVRTAAGWKYAFGQVGRVVESNGQAIKP